MAFGISFGAKKQSQTSNTAMDKTENVSGSQSQATTGTNSGTQSTSQTGTQNTTGTSYTDSRTQQQNTTTEQGRQTGTATTLSGDIQASLGDAVKRILAGGVNDANLASLSNMISGVSTFNPSAMVSGIVDQARNRGEQTLQESTSRAGNAIGGTASTNSMTALLAQRGRNDLEASIGGITADAVAKAMGVQQGNIGAASTGMSAVASQAAGLADVLKGATTTTDQTTLTNQIAQLLGQNTQAGQQAQATQSSQQQQTQTMEIINQLVNALTNQKTQTTGTESTRATASEKGGGLSLGF